MKKLLLLLLCVPLIGFGQCISGDCENGYGAYIYDNGDKYVGEFKKEVRNGQGVFIWGKGKWEGNKYVGEWQNDKMHGQGTLNYANGDKYVGGFKDGTFHGEGTYTEANGTVTKGLWENGEFLGEE